MERLAQGRAALSEALDQDIEKLAETRRGIDGIVAVQTFYGMAEALARARGSDPDRPRHLAKVTLTR